MDSKNIKLRDAIVFFKGVVDPYIGAITLNKTSNNVTKNIIIRAGIPFFIPVDEIELMIFKGNATLFGIYANGAIYSSEKYDYWNKETSKIAKRELESCGIYGN